MYLFPYLWIWYSLLESIIHNLNVQKISLKATLNYARRGQVKSYLIFLIYIFFLYKENNLQFKLYFYIFWTPYFYIAVMPVLMFHLEKGDHRVCYGRLHGRRIGFKKSIIEPRNLWTLPYYITSKNLNNFIYSNYH